MRTDRKGVIDLPVKLMVIVLILSISVPMVANAMENGERSNAAAAMDSETDRIFNAVAAVHYSGIGSTRTVSVNIPEGCEIMIPGGSGSDAYSLIMSFKGHQTSVRYMDRPPVMFMTDGMRITGSCMLLMTCDIIGDRPAVRIEIV